MFLLSAFFSRCFGLDASWCLWQPLSINLRSDSEPAPNPALWPPSLFLAVRPFLHPNTRICRFIQPRFDCCDFFLVNWMTLFAVVSCTPNSTPRTKCLITKPCRMLGGASWGSSLAIVDSNDTRSGPGLEAVYFGQNLAAALIRLRHADQPRTLWCNLICVNQQDLPERSTQVARMGDVYRHASRVIVVGGGGGVVVQVTYQHPLMTIEALRCSHRRDSSRLTYPSILNRG